MLYRLLVFLLFFIGNILLAAHFFGDKLKNTKWQKRPQNMLNTRKEMITGKKLSRIERFKEEAETALRLSNSRLKWEQYEILTALMAVVGVIIGLLLNNMLLAIVMAFVMAYVPIAILTVKRYLYEMSLNEQLQTALNTINAAYMKNNDITRAVQDNLKRIPEPLNTIFSDFVASYTFVDSNTVRNIQVMREKINNRFWHEWCDYLILAQSDRDMRAVLLTIVEEMSGVKNMQEEIKTAMFKIYREFALIAGIVVFAVPGFSVLNHNWYVYLTDTLAGKIVVTVAYLVTFLSFIHVIRVNRPMNEL